MSSIDGLADDVAKWRQGAAGRAPAYHRVLEEIVALLDADGALAERLQAAWAARSFAAFYERPLLLLAALRRDALGEGAAHPLWGALAAHEPDPDRVTRAALSAALARKSAWRSLRDRFVQTNETTRALAWLWPAAIAGGDQGGRVLHLVEIGAAAGLNLVADRLPAPWTHPGGAPLAIVQAPRVATRLGIDAHPLDARSDDDAAWLRACVWAGERTRLQRLEAAIAAFRAAPARLEQGDVTDAPPALRVLSAAAAERDLVLAFQTIVRDYLDASTRAAYEHGMRGWLDDAPAGRALWVELEIDHGKAVDRVPLAAHARSSRGAVDLVLGTTGYHPATVAVDDDAVARLAELFR